MGTSWRLATISSLIPTPDICKIQIHTASKERHLHHLENEARGGRSPQNRTGSQRSRPTASECFSLSAQPGQVTAPARPQWPHLDNEDQPDDAEARETLWSNESQLQDDAPQRLGGALGDGNTIGRPAFSPRNSLRGDARCPAWPGGHPPPLCLGFPGLQFSQHVTCSAGTRELNKGPWGLGRRTERHSCLSAQTPSLGICLSPGRGPKEGVWRRPCHHAHCLLVCRVRSCT